MLTAFSGYYSIKISASQISLTAITIIQSSVRIIKYLALRVKQLTAFPECVKNRSVHVLGDAQNVIDLFALYAQLDVKALYRHARDLICLNVRPHINYVAVSENKLICAHIAVDGENISHIQHTHIASEYLALVIICVELITGAAAFVYKRCEPVKMTRFSDCQSIGSKLPFNKLLWVIFPTVKGICLSPWGK